MRNLASSRMEIRLHITAIGSIKLREAFDDISKALFEKRFDIMGQAAQALIEKKYGHLLDQEYCKCPHCHKNVKAKSEKVRREVILMACPIVLRLLLLQNLPRLTRHLAFLVDRNTTQCRLAGS